ncbi:uncharacterized protein LOC143023991 [Oratosquilla oratoria]|uniref:uncharacterized protein LOC143023991 n=1 Tax=Oratosquilla oratoria TaxID=337810 RepID=UPI003F760FFC
MKVALFLCLLATTQAFVVLPYTAGSIGAVPYHVQPLTYVAPVLKAAPIHPGYVAVNPGATHIAPLPEGLAYASHHVNLEKAPGSE